MVLLIFLLAAAVLLASYATFRMGFYAPRKEHISRDMDLPEGEIYEVFWDSMRKWILETRATPHEDVAITSFDGLTLRGKYYEYAPGAPIELMFHGYRGSAERDMCGGMQRCFKLGHSALIVDQRCSGGSGGTVITFGIHEYKDCLRWVDFAVDRFGPQVQLILTGMSMGAATVLMAGGEKLPDILFTMAVVYALGANFVNLLVALTLAYFTNYVRLVRSQVLTLSEADYVEAARAGGSGSMRIILTHIIPNAVGVIIVNTTLNVAKIILYESTLSFLGLGMPPPAPEWGAMLSEAREHLRNYPYMMVFPAAAIVLTACSVNLVGDGLRDALDPHLKS